MQTERIATSPTAAQQIGRLLRELRNQQRMTGEQLARKAGISQSRVSKIENGYSSSIDAGQIEKLLDILNSPKIIRQQVHLLLFRLSDGLDARFIYPFTEMPGVLDDLQANTACFRCYIVCGISATLQTSEYRLAYLKRLGLSAGEAQIELGRTIARQEALWDATKTFYFVMPEAALYTLPANARIQIAQLDRLERIIGAKNIHIGIIPLQAGASFFETGTFTFYDDQILYVFMGDRLIQLEDSEVLLKYRNAFDELSQMACFGAEAITLIRKSSDYFMGLS